MYAVPLHCQSCVDSVSSVLAKDSHISLFNVDLNKQIVSITSSLPPSSIISLIQETGKDAIIRGTGKPNSAAVCILESFDNADLLQPVKGLARIVSLSNGTKSLIDLTLNGVEKGTYYPTLRASGDISQGVKSMGPAVKTYPPIIVTEEHEERFFSQSFIKDEIKITEIIGRGFSVSGDNGKEYVGVIARSAGIWENDKKVCYCSGKTIWEERKDMVQKGVN